jgi:hypothetical protein
VIDLGRARKRLRGAESATSRGSRLLASLALATALKARLEAGGVNRAALAREQGITRARVTQLLALLSLPAEVIAWIRGGGAHETHLSERQLRPLLSRSRTEQLRGVATLAPSFGASRRARA